VKLAEHNKIELVCVPGHVGLYGNKIADELAIHSQDLSVHMVYLEGLPGG